MIFVQKKCKPVARRQATSGFTLLEILIVMTLLSVVMLGLASALRTIAQTEVRVNQRLEQSDALRVNVSFIQSTLGRMSIRPVNAQAGVVAAPVLFSARESAIEWIGIMPARYGAGGRSYFRLMVEPVNGVDSLVIRFAPWTSTSRFPDWSGTESRILAKDVERFSVECEDARSSPSEWTLGWTNIDRPPARVRLSLKTQGGAWPSLVIPLRALPAGDTSGLTSW